MYTTTMHLYNVHMYVQVLCVHVICTYVCYECTVVRIRHFYTHIPLCTVQCIEILQYVQLPTCFHCLWICTPVHTFPLHSFISLVSSQEEDIFIQKNPQVNLIGSSGPFTLPTAVHLIKDFTKCTKYPLLVTISD